MGRWRRCVAWIWVCLAWGGVTWGSQGLAAKSGNADPKNASYWATYHSLSGKENTGNRTGWFWLKFDKQGGLKTPHVGVWEENGEKFAGVEFGYEDGFEFLGIEGTNEEVKGSVAGVPVSTSTDWGASLIDDHFSVNGCAKVSSKGLKASLEAGLDVKAVTESSANFQTKVDNVEVDGTLTFGLAAGLTGHAEAVVEVNWAPGTDGKTRITLNYGLGVGVGAYSNLTLEMDTAALLESVRNGGLKKWVDFLKQFPMTSEVVQKFLTALNEAVALVAQEEAAEKAKQEAEAQAQQAQASQASQSTQSNSPGTSSGGSGTGQTSSGPSPSTGTQVASNASIPSGGDQVQSSGSTEQGIPMADATIEETDGAQSEDAATETAEGSTSGEDATTDQAEEPSTEDATLGEDETSSPDEDGAVVEEESPDPEEEDAVEEDEETGEDAVPKDDQPPATDAQP